MFIFVGLAVVNGSSSVRVASVMAGFRNCVQETKRGHASGEEGFPVTLTLTHPHILNPLAERADYLHFDYRLKPVDRGAVIGAVGFATGAVGATGIDTFAMPGIACGTPAMGGAEVDGAIIPGAIAAPIGMPPGIDPGIAPLIGGLFGFSRSMLPRRMTARIVPRRWASASGSSPG